MGTQEPEGNGPGGLPGKFTPEQTTKTLERTEAAARPPEIKAVVFDYGCVLSAVPGPEAFEPLRKAVGAETAAFQEMYWRNREAYDFDTLDVANYFREMGSAAGVVFTPEQIETLGRLDFEIWATPNPVMVEWVRALRGRGLKIGVLSNMSRNVGDYLRRESQWLQLFHHLCFSGELKIGKPDPAIYRSCLESLGVTAAETLFLDDREPNIQAAEALGIHGILFHSAQELLPALVPYGLAESLEQVMAPRR